MDYQSIFLGKSITALKRNPAWSTYKKLLKWKWWFSSWIYPLVTWWIFPVRYVTVYRRVKPPFSYGFPWFSYGFPLVFQRVFYPKPTSTCSKGQRTSVRGRPWGRGCENEKKGTRDGWDGQRTRYEVMVLSHECGIIMNWDRVKTYYYQF